MTAHFIRHERGDGTGGTRGPQHYILDPCMSEDPSPATKYARGRTDDVEKKRARPYKRKHEGVWWPYSSAGLPGVPRLIAKEKIQHCTRVAVERASASAQRIWKLHDSPIRQTEVLLSISSFPSSAVRGQGKVYTATPSPCECCKSSDIPSGWLSSPLSSPWLSAGRKSLTSALIPM